MNTVLSASSLSGDAVQNAEGEKLGDIKDIMLDTRSGEIAYYVLSFGGFMGMGDKLFAVPPQAMTLNSEDHSFTLNVEKELLKNAPGFNKDDWPNMANPQFKERIYSHYGYSHTMAKAA